ncbi:Protein of unknown function DUF3112 [Lasallia pustulata]|uniref:Uncharacterized protein n=1 Tax=Lasallia pustulata TaxID=136370 RepID=A0A1W5D201_9LECA|nr:Protein of unknown function DUF3112 [Lasallia pustulata]
MGFSSLSGRQDAQSGSSQSQQHGPPYAPTNASLGGLPTVKLDVPITSVFLGLFLLGAIGHMTVFQVNRKHGHNFVISGAMFGFCMARSVACIMRIVWANRPRSVPIALAASIFVLVGSVIGFIVNLNFAHRIIRALNPKVGWHPALKLTFIFIYCLVGISIALLVSFTVASFYTLDPAKRRNTRDVQLYGSTVFAVVSFLPIPMVLVALATGPKTGRENFGVGTIRSKIILLFYGATLLALGAWFRAGTNYLTPRPASRPRPDQSKACFYVFYFTVEILVIWTYLIFRIDQRYHVPDGSRGPGDYSKSVFYEMETAKTGMRGRNYSFTSSLQPICEGPVIY